MGGAFSRSSSELRIKMVATQLLPVLVLLFLTSGVEAQTSGSVRLVGKGGVTSSTLTAGRVEVYYYGEWGTVCDDGFGASEAQTICNQLGFSTDYYYSYPNYGTISTANRFDVAPSSNQIWLDNLNCPYDAVRLTQCTHNGIGVENCYHSEDVYVSCIGNGALRLINRRSSSSTSSGRLEIYYNRKWGTVCENSFGQTEANVACRQLGYESASSYASVGILGYSEGTGKIWLDNVQCSSYSIMLSACSHNQYGDQDCSHSMDVALSCSSLPTASPPPTALSPLPTAFGPQPTTLGPLPTAFGPLPTTLGPLPTTFGPLPTTFGPLPTALSPLPTAMSSSLPVRLVGKNSYTSSSLTAGRLEVYHNGQWGTVCDDYFETNEARTACRHLGFSAGYVEYGTISTDNRFDSASSSTPIWLDDIYCSTDDLVLSQCTISEFGDNYCSHSEDVYINCVGNGALRIESGYYSSSNSGRLEIYHNGKWRTVCEHSFGQTEANVACRQLGYESASSYGRVGTLGYSQGTGKIWQDNVQCISADVELSSCTHNRFDNSDCTHYQDIAVSCSKFSYNHGFSSAAIAGIVVAVLVPLICIIVVMVVLICACRSLNRQSNGSNVSMVSRPSSTSTVVATSSRTIQAHAQTITPPPTYDECVHYTHGNKGPQSAPASYPAEEQYSPQNYSQEQGYPQFQFLLATPYTQSEYPLGQPYPPPQPNSQPSTPDECSDEMHHLLSANQLEDESVISGQLMNDK